MAESENFTPYPGWELDVLQLAEQANRDYEGTKMATELGMPEALAAQRLLAAFPPLCPAWVECGNKRQTCARLTGHGGCHRSNGDHSITWFSYG